MKKIQMVDLQSQYDKIQPQIDKAILEVVSSAAFINGPEVKNFQKDLEEYLDVKHVIPCANGTDALQIAMMGLGLEPGDEVITADFTFAATVEVIDHALCGHPRIRQLVSGRRRCHCVYSVPLPTAPCLSRSS